MPDPNYYTVAWNMMPIITILGGLLIIGLWLAQDSNQTLGSIQQQMQLLFAAGFIWCLWEVVYRYANIPQSTSAAVHLIAWIVLSGFSVTVGLRFLIDYSPGDDAVLFTVGTVIWMLAHIALATIELPTARAAFSVLIHVPL